MVNKWLSQQELNINSNAYQILDIRRKIKHNISNLYLRLSGRDKAKQMLAH